MPYFVFGPISFAAMNPEFARVPTSNQTQTIIAIGLQSYKLLKRGFSGSPRRRRPIAFVVHLNVHRAITYNI